MQTKVREDFTETVKKRVGRRVGWRCSKPDCGKLTCGPGESEGVALYRGEVAHITAASPNGPRYDPNMSKKERTSDNNAIFLCTECADIIDQDKEYFTVEMLHQWKKDAEARAKQEFEVSGTRKRYGYTAKGFLPYHSSVALSQIKKIFEKELVFFPMSEQKHMGNMVQRLEQEDSPYALLCGMPASGKSVFLYEIARQFDKKGYKAYYYTCKEGFVPHDLIQDLNFYEEIDPSAKKLYIIDDIHLSQEMVTVFFERVLSEGIGGAILFVSRNVKKDNRSYIDDSIYERLDNVTFELEFSQDTKNTKNGKSQLLTTSDSINKIKGIIRNFSKSIKQDNELKQLEDDEIVQLADKVGYDLVNLRYYLQTWEGENKKNPGIGLDMIEKKDVLKHVYDVSLSSISPLNRIAVIKYASLYQYEISFELHINDFDIFSGMLKDGQISKENQLYSFYHSKYAELLVQSFVACDEFFDTQYKNLCDLVIVNIGDYIKSYYYNRGRKYPKNMFELFEGILTTRNAHIHDDKLENGMVFSGLIRDTKIKEIALIFFNYGDIETIRIQRFMEIIKKYSAESYDELCEQLIYRENYAWLKNHLMTHRHTSNFYAFVLFVNNYSGFYEVFDDEEIKKIIDVSGAIAIKYLYQLNSQQIQKHIKLLFTKEEWFDKLKDSNMSQIREIFNNIEKVDKDFATQLWIQFSDDDLMERMNEDFIREMTHTMPLCKKLNGEQLVRILKCYEDDFIVKNVNDFIKTHSAKKNMQIVSDFIQQMADADRNRTSEILQRVEFENILQVLETYTFSQISSFFAKLKKVDMDKTSKLLNKVDMGFLYRKIAEEPAHKIINSIAGIRSINEDMAKELFENVKEELIRKIQKINLETFLSYEGSMRNLHPDAIGEIIGRLPDDYIRGYKDLGDIRDMPRLIRLYACVDFNIWQKEYVLDEIVDYVDSHFEKNF